ncbi:MAG: hypothetical protein QW116_01890 [Zestosphaera sp.]
MTNYPIFRGMKLRTFLVSLVISSWILLTSHALRVMQDPIGIPLTGSLIVITLIAPLLYPKDSPRYDALAFSSLFVSYIAIVNVAFSFSSARLPPIGSLYIILTTLLMITVIAWNLATKLSFWELSTHLPIFFFLAMLLMDELPGVEVSAYMLIWIPALATLASRSFKVYLSDVMSICFAFLPFIGVYYLVPDVTVVPHMLVVTATELTNLILAVIASFTIASFISIITRTTPGGEVSNILAVVISHLLPLLGFVGSFYLSMSVLRSEPFYSYLELNAASVILAGVITSFLTMSSYYVKVVVKEKKYLMTILDRLAREIDALKQVYDVMKSSGLWSEEELEPIRSVIAELEYAAGSSKLELSRRLISTAKFQALHNVMESIKRDIDKVSTNMLELFDKSLNTLTKSIALIAATPYSSEYLREKLPGVQSARSVTDILSYIGAVSGLLRDSCSRLKSLILNTYMTVIEQFGPISLRINGMESVNCFSSSAMVRDTNSMLAMYSSLVDFTLPKLRTIHSGLVKLGSLLNDMLGKLSRKPLRDLDSALLIEKMRHILADVPEIISEPEVISYLRTCAATYTNLLNVTNDLCNSLYSDINKVGMKIKSMYGEKIDVEELLLSRLRRHVDLIRSKVSKESIVTPDSLTRGFNELLTEMPSVLENVTLVLERLTILNNLAEHLKLFGDYIMYELSRRGTVNINELPFTTEVSIQLLWILLMSRTDIEVREGVVYMKRGS